MPLSPDKFDPKKQLQEELKLQENYAQLFFVYINEFVQICQFHDLEHQSEKINAYMLDAIETRNEISTRYSDLKKSLKEDGHIVAEIEHQNLQKDVLKSMDYIIEETSCLAIPKTLHEDSKKEINRIRTKVLSQLNRIRDIFYSNDLGMEGEAVLI